MRSVQVFLSTLLVVFNSAQASGSTSQSGNNQTTCNMSEHNASVIAYVGWPFRVDCEHLTKVWKERNPLRKDELECRLHYNGIRQTENIFVLENDKENTIFIADLYVHNIRCLTSHVRLNLLPFPDESCQTSRDDPARMVHIESVMQDDISLECSELAAANYRYPDVIPDGANRADFKTVWITNDCSEKRYRFNNFWENMQGPEGYGDTLHMPTVDFYDAVNFTCSVEYRGKILYPVSYQMCMRQRHIQQTPSLICVKSQSVKKNGNAQFSCSGQMAGGMTQPGDFRMLWKKGDEILCRNRDFESTEMGVDGRFSCIADDQTDNEPFKCVYFERITDNDIQPVRKSIKLNFWIRDVQCEDYGDYRAEFSVAVNGVWRRETRTLKLIKDQSYQAKCLRKPTWPFLWLDSVVQLLSTAGHI